MLHMNNEEFLRESLEIVAKVETENLEEFFNNIEESVKAKLDCKNKKAALEFIRIMRDEKGIDLLEELLKKEVLRRKAIEVRKITRQMIMTWDDTDMAFQLYNMRKDNSISILDVLNYGYMRGKQDERAKKKAHRSA